MDFRRSGRARALCALLVALYLLAPTTAASVHAGGRVETGQGVGGAQDPGSPVSTFSISQSSAYPVGVTTDASGHVWFAEDNLNSLGELFPSNSTIKTFPIPTNHHLAWIWYMFFDKNGVLWFSDEMQPLIWNFNPSTDTFSNFTAGKAFPMVLHYEQGKDRIWFTSLTTDQLGYFDIVGEKAALERVVNITAPERGAGLSGITLDSAGNVFVSETFEGRIAELEAGTLSVVRTWSLPKGSQPVGLALDQARGVLWFTNHATSFFGYVDLNSTSYREYSTSLLFLGGSYAVTLPYWVFLSQSGYVWFNEHVGNKIARFDPKNSQLTEFDIPTNSSSPLMISLDDRLGQVWFTEFSGNALAMIEQNSSLGTSLTVSPSASTADPTATVTATSTPASLYAPVVSSTAESTGEPQPGFETSTTSKGSSQVVRLTAYQATPGNYTVAVCFAYTYVNQCGYATVVVPKVSSGFLSYQLYVVVATLGGGALVFELVRERRRGRLRTRRPRERLDRNRPAAPPTTTAATAAGTRAEGGTVEPDVTVSLSMAEYTTPD